MARERKPTWSDDEGDGDGEECPVCHQEFSHGVCPIRSADCPYLEEADGGGSMDEEEEEP